MSVARSLVHVERDLLGHFFVVFEFGVDVGDPNCDVLVFGCTVRLGNREKWLMNGTKMIKIVQNWRKKS